MDQPACPPQCNSRQGADRQEPDRQEPDRRPAPQVSVIIANYNGAAYLPACLTALLTTSPSAEATGAEVTVAEVTVAEVTVAEVIVIDNASTDRSLALLAGWADRVRTVPLQSNIGYGAANNLGSAIAQAPYLVFLNPDTEVEAGWLAPLIDALAGDDQCGLDVHISGLTLCHGLDQMRDRFQRTEPTTSISGAACAMRKDLFLDLGGFDQAFFLYMEDTDLSWRVRRIIRSRRAVQARRRSADRQLLARCTPRLAFDQVGRSTVTALAGMVFEPLFRLLQWGLLAVVRG